MVTKSVLHLNLKKFKKKLNPNSKSNVFNTIENNEITTIAKECPINNLYKKIA